MASSVSSAIGTAPDPLGLVAPGSVPALQGGGSVRPRRWLRRLLFPLELLAVAWSLPIVILLMLAPLGVAFWLGRMLLAIF
jgi:hypothetical protein